MRAIFATLVLVLACQVVSAELIVSRGTSGVEHYSNGGTFLGVLIAPGTGGLVDAQGVAVGPNGDLYVGDFTNSNILRFTSTGTFLGVFSNAGAVDTPFDVVFGPGGELLVASAGATSNIAQLDSAGNLITGNFTSGNATPIGGPQYLGFGPTLAISDIAGHVFRFDLTTGTFISLLILDNPEGVAFAPNGDLYIAQRIVRNVIRVPAGGGPIEVVIPDNSFDGPPQDIAFGPNGLLYISANSIYRYDVSGANGVLVDHFGTGGEFLVFRDAADVPEPSTLVFGGAGLAWVAWRRRGLTSRRNIVV
jgi:DNA-binding beta-propeller fold protein YncE